MAVVKLSDGSLWVHSPVGLDEPLRHALEEIGPVAHIVSPNFEHVRCVTRGRKLVRSKQEQERWGGHLHRISQLDALETCHMELVP